MLAKRENAASATFPNGSVLVTGGVGRRGAPLQSSELLSGSDRTPSLQLPSARSSHCLLALSSGGLFLHGGYLAGYTRIADTHISTNLQTWEPMKPSKKPRGGHACTEVTIKDLQQVWIGGGISGEDPSTSEIYLVSSNTWTQGPDIPNFESASGEFATYLDHVYYAGGSGKYSNFGIYKLKDNWTQQDGWTKVKN